MGNIGLRKGRVFAAFALLALILAVGAACGVKMMPSHDPWYMEHYIIMQEFEQGVYKALTDEGKVTFQTLFWEARSPKSREIFKERLEYVAQKFKAENSATPWNTDRGRMYLLNGSPASIDVKQTDSWGVQAQEGAGIGGITTDRSGEDVQARSAEIWTYQFGQNLIQYFFQYSPPKQWKLATGTFSGNRYLGQFEAENRRVYYGIEDVESYTRSIQNLPKIVK